MLWPLAVSSFFIDKSSPILLVYAVVPSPSRFSKTWHTMFLILWPLSLSSFTEKINETNRKPWSLRLLATVLLRREGT